MAKQKNVKPSNAKEMENTSQSAPTGARIIHLRPMEISNSSEQHQTHLPTILEYHTLEYIDQLLEEHFR